MQGTPCRGATWDFSCWALGPTARGRAPQAAATVSPPTTTSDRGIGRKTVLTRPVPIQAQQAPSIFAVSDGQSRPTARGSWKNGPATPLAAACTPLLITGQSHPQVHVHTDRLSLSPATLGTSSLVMRELQQRRRARQTDNLRRANSVLARLVHLSLPSLTAQHFRTQASSRDSEQWSAVSRDTSSRVTSHSFVIAERTRLRLLRRAGRFLADSCPCKTDCQPSKPRYSSEIRQRFVATRDSPSLRKR